MGGTYRLLARLEASELCELYRASPTASTSRCALKLFHARTTDVVYSRALASLSAPLGPQAHPGVMRVLEIGMYEGRLIVVRDDVDGYSVGQVLRRLHTREVVLSPAVAMMLVLDLVEIVQSAHEAGVVHGAITPGNALVSQGGHGALCDFGALAALTASPALRRSFASGGRLSYRSPEVLRGEPATEISDVYSLGAIAYELLTLREPALDRTRTRGESLPPPSRLDRRLSTRVDAVIGRALEPAVSRRFRSCGELAVGLREVLASTGGQPPRSELVRFLGELFPREPAADPTPPPFESVTLEAVSGAALPEDERSLAHAQRPSFTELPTAATETLGEDTASETSWDAPPAPVAPRVAPSDASIRDRHRRVKWIEDFTGPAATAVDLPAATQQMDQRALASDAGSPPPQHLVSGSYPMVRTEGVVRRMNTHEHRLFRASIDRRRVQLVTVLLALAAAFVVLIVAGRQAKQEEAAPKPRPVMRESRRKERPLNARAPVPSTGGEDREGASAVAERRRADREGEVGGVEGWHQPPLAGAAYVNLRSNAPVTVYVDGKRVRQEMPLQRYPVEPGERTVTLVNTETGEKRQLLVVFDRGELQTLDEKFDAAPSGEQP